MIEQLHGVARLLDDDQVDGQKNRVDHEGETRGRDGKKLQRLLVDFEHSLVTERQSRRERFLRRTSRSDGFGGDTVNRHAISPISETNHDNSTIFVLKIDVIDINVQEIVLNVQEIVLNIEDIVLNVQEIVLNFDVIDINVQEIVLDIEEIFLSINESIVDGLVDRLRGERASRAPRLIGSWTSYADRISMPNAPEQEARARIDVQLAAFLARMPESYPLVTAGMPDCQGAKRVLFRGGSARRRAVSGHPAPPRSH